MSVSVCERMWKWAIWIQRTWKRFRRVKTVLLKCIRKMTKTTTTSAQKFVWGCGMMGVVEAIKRWVAFVCNNLIKWYISLFNRMKFQTNYSFNILNQIRSAYLCDRFWRTSHFFVCVQVFVCMCHTFTHTNLMFYCCISEFQKAYLYE